MEAVWATELVRRREKCLAPAGNWTPLVQPGAQSHHDDMVTCEQTSPSIMVSSSSFLRLCCASKGEVVPVLNYTNTTPWRRMGSGCIDAYFLDLDTSWRCVVSGTPGTHWIGGWVDARTGLDDVEKRKCLTLPRLELEPSVVQPAASRYTDYAI
jgi:hypothetical protein